MANRPQADWLGFMLRISKRRVGTAHHSGTILHWWAMPTLRNIFTAVVLGVMIVGFTTGCKTIAYYHLAESPEGPRVHTLSLWPCQNQRVNIKVEVLYANWTSYRYVKLKISNRMDDTLLFDIAKACVITATYDSVSVRKVLVNDQISSTPIRLRPGKKERIRLHVNVERHNPQREKGYPYQVHLGELRQLDGSLLCSLPPIFADLPSSRYEK